MDLGDIHNLDKGTFIGDLVSRHNIVICDKIPEEDLGKFPQNLYVKIGNKYKFATSRVSFCTRSKKSLSEIINKLILRELTIDDSNKKSSHLFGTRVYIIMKLFWMRCHNAKIDNYYLSYGPFGTSLYKHNTELVSGISYPKFKDFSLIEPTYLKEILLEQFKWNSTKSSRATFSD